MSSQAGSSNGSLRRLNRVMFLPLLVLGGMLSVAFDVENYWQGIVLGLGVAAAVVAFLRWSSGLILSLSGVVCLVVAAAVWVFGALSVGSSTSFFSIMVVGTLIVPAVPRHRNLAAVALVAFVAAVGSTRLLWQQDDLWEVLIRFVLIPAGVTAAVTGLMFPNKRFYDVVADLEESRDREAELAVARERIRFASDLHDIQGHTLHVVKLKIALAQKLLHSDLPRVEEELREVYALVGDTISQTKELAYAQRRLNLSVELENAKNLFEAAGIRVQVDREAGVVEPGVGELLGQVLRETTTNILRHAQATQVQITLSQSGIVIANDGAVDELPQLHGLATLSDRLASSGGKLTVTQDGGRFCTAATFVGTDIDPMPLARRIR